MHRLIRFVAIQLFALIGLIAWSTVASAQSASASRLDDISARGVLRVGTTGDYKPFSFRIGKSNNFIGSDIELAASLAQALNVKLQLVPTSWPSLMQDFSAGKFDLAISGVSITPERQKVAQFSIPYLRDGKTPIARCENSARFQTLAQIDQADVRLIVNPGGTNERFAKANAPHAQLTVYPDNVSIFDQIVNQQADLMITDAIETKLQQHLHPELCAIHPEAPFDHSEKAILLPRDAQLQTVINLWLQLSIANGSVQKAMDRWLYFPWGLESLRRAVDERLLLAEAVARAKWNVQAPIEDLAREEQVIQAAVKQGAEFNLASNFVESVFRAQIQASKTVQRDLFAKWTAQHAGKFADAPDLAKTIRPELDRITTQLLRSLAVNQAVLVDPARKNEVLQALGVLDAAELSKTAAEQALAPLLQGGR